MPGPGKRAGGDKKVEISGLEKAHFGNVEHDDPGQAKAARLHLLNRTREGVRLCTSIRIR